MSVASPRSNNVRFGDHRGTDSRRAAGSPPAGRRSRRCRRHEAELIDHLAAMERLKGGLAAAQARVRRPSPPPVAGPRRRVACRGRAVPGSGRRDRAGPAREPGPRSAALRPVPGLVHEMPQTLAALAQGDISEYRAMLLVKETAVLTSEHRRQVDGELARPTRRARRPCRCGRGQQGRLPARSRVRAAARAGARRPGRGFTPGAGHDELPDRVPPGRAGRGVQGGAGEGSRLHARAGRRAQPRGRSWPTPWSSGSPAGLGRRTNVEIQLVMTEASLLGGDDEPARLAGFGPIPAATAREPRAKSRDRPGSAGFHHP